MAAKTLQELLNSEAAIVVPEIQREYVWGAKESIRNQFVDSLENRKEQSVNLGFLYTYKNNGETYLIDGQQRFTTIILMLYFLSLASDEDKKDFKRIMKSDKAGMSFSYRVRSNTEQFMKDLFVSGLIERGEIVDSVWYHSYYDADKSIQSMLELLEYLNHRKKSGNLSITYNKLLGVGFWCYPVEETSVGEELYITMNSRGKALDSSERLKPLLFEKERGRGMDLKWGKEWDEWEEFFFTNLDNKQNISGVNEAMSNILLLIWDLETCRENKKLRPVEAVRELNLPRIKEYVEALRILSEYREYRDEIKILYGSKENAKGKSDADMIMLKALLSVVYKFKYRSDYELKRVYERIYNAQHRRKILKHKPILEILKEYRGAEEKTFYQVLESMCDNWNEKDSFPFDKSEMLMVKEMKKSIGIECVCSDFTETEKAFWSACDCAAYHCHWIWNGDLRIFIEWSREDKGFDLSRFGHYIGLIEKLFPGDAAHEIDIVRRAWIIGMGNYEPVPVKGGYRSFGWEWSDWWHFISNSHDEFKNFLEEVGNGGVENYIKNNYKKEKQYSEFAKDNYLLDFTHGAEACDMSYNWDTEDWELCVGGSRTRHYKTKVVSVHNLCILRAFGANSSNSSYADGKELNEDWKVWWWYGNRIAVENGNLHLVFDLWYNNRKKNCKILFKSRNGEDVSKYSSCLEGFKHSEEDSEEGYVLNITQSDFSPEEIVNKVKELTNIVSREVARGTAQ